jgi:riboflavin kinase/FMN adenylyltransferase
VRVETGLVGDRLGSAGITIGTFDGVHLAHTTAIRHLCQVSSANGWNTIVITFDNHPRCVLDPDHCPPLITTLDEKLTILDGLGVDVTWVMPFTPELAGLSPEDFMRRVGSRVDIRHFVSGPDFALGHERGGDNAWLREYGERNGFDTEVMPSLEVDGVELHSSDIRRLLEAGEVSRAATLLGRPFRLQGPVESGARVGRRLGFPTANVALPPGKLIPGEGIYAGVVKLPTGEWPGALSIGRRPTFDGERLVVEVHILDFSGDIYGVEIGVDIIERLRGQEKYEGVDALVSQIALDVEETRRLLAR